MKGKTTVLMSLCMIEKRLWVIILYHHVSSRSGGYGRGGPRLFRGRRGLCDGSGRVHLDGERGFASFRGVGVSSSGSRGSGSSGGVGGVSARRSGRWMRCLGLGGV